MRVWKEHINQFLREKLRLTLHPDKSRIIPLARGVDFVGFRNFAHFTLLRKRNIRKMRKKITAYKQGATSFGTLFDSYKGWKGYAQCANTYTLRKNLKRGIIDILWEKV